MGQILHLIDMSNSVHSIISTLQSTYSEAQMIYIAWIIFGALAGWIASIITGKNRKMGAVANIVVGIIGAFIGGGLMNLFGIQGISGFSFGSLIVAIIGAVILIFVTGLIRR
jgi:uncharacterized membrane protein YeaQ/YmgE (transglycosylase-associated protein family)